MLPHEWIWDSHRLNTFKIMNKTLGLPAFVLAVLLFLGLPLASSSGYVAVSVGIAPPAIPVYEQPLCPGPGYIWTPGYWAWGDFGYYWVPGIWVLAPQIGYYWTPGYWAFSSGRYFFHDGYWGPSVGFYGGINYGYGYYGNGYYGGRWEGNHFAYNTAVSRVNTRVIKNTYVNREVARNVRGSRPSFNGPGGVQAKPTQKQLAAAKGKRIEPTAAQRSRATAARNDPDLRAKNNKAQPKASAVRNFHRTHEPSTSERTTADKNRNRAGQNATESRDRGTNRSTTEARTRQGQRAGAENRANRTNRTADRAQARSDERSASSRSRRGNETRRHEAPRVTSKSHREQSAPRRERATASHRAVSRQPQVTSKHRAAPRREAAAPRKGASQHQKRTATSENRKKKKKRGGNGG